MKPTHLPSSATIQKLACLFAFTMLIGAQSSAAADRPRNGAELVQQGNRFLAEDKFAEALEAYDQALEALPDSAKVAYNRGIALYRLGRFADAETAFQNAQDPNRPELEAMAKYNLARSVHAKAMRKTDDLNSAIEDLKQAIDFYNDALQLRPRDPDTLQNLAQAERLRGYLQKKLEQLRKQQKEQEQDDKKQEGDQENESDQQGDDQKEGEGEKKEDGDDQQNAQQPKPSTQPSDEREPTSQPSTQPSKEPEPASQPTSQPSEQSEHSPKNDPTSRPTSTPTTQPESEKDASARMSREEAQRMLQEAQDAEQKRRELRRIRLLRRQGRITPDKDW